jgi:hypothetical protein
VTRMVSTATPRVPEITSGGRPRRVHRDADGAGLVGDRGGRGPRAGLAQGAARWSVRRSRRRLRGLAYAARDGDIEALERVVAAVQDDVYRLALRMLWHPEDAKDVAQEAAAIMLPLPRHGRTAAPGHAAPVRGVSGPW